MNVPSWLRGPGYPTPIAGYPAVVEPAPTSPTPDTQTAVRAEEQRAAVQRDLIALGLVDGASGGQRPRS
jgi:hypothetical protein